MIISVTGFIFLSIYSTDIFGNHGLWFSLMIFMILRALTLKFYFNKYKSDKSLNHNYHLIYGALFPDTNKVKKILEIGLGTNNEKLISNMGKNGSPGASVRAFRDFFKNLFSSPVKRMPTDRLFDEWNLLQFEHLFEHFEVKALVHLKLHRDHF